MSWWRRLTYPRDLMSFFQTKRCPNCGSEELVSWQDGGHDFAFKCEECSARYGVGSAPFFIIERLT